MVDPHDRRRSTNRARLNSSWQRGRRQSPSPTRNRAAGRTTVAPTSQPVAPYPAAADTAASNAAATATFRGKPLRRTKTPKWPRLINPPE